MQRFGKEYKHIYERDNVHLYLDASVKRLTFSRIGNQQVVDTVVACNSKGETLSFSAENFVLCAGGIENARILLNSPSEESGCALGNEHDQVGRYMMNHPKRYQGIVNFTRPLRYVPYYFGCMAGGYSGFAGVRLSDEIQRKYELVSAYIRFEPIFPWTDSPGVDALVPMLRGAKGILTTLSKFRKNGIVELRSFAETGDTQQAGRKLSAVTQLWYVIKDFRNVAHYLWYRIFGQPAIKQVRLCTFMEMEPSRHNRVTLAKERDAHGYKLPMVSYAPTERDQRSVQILSDTFIKEIESTARATVSDVFSIDGDFYKSINQFSGYDASHHIGTTRMGKSPEYSVVDASLLVHGVRNIYVAGSSVFPSSGVANPTFSIVALSIRLAEKLSEQYVFT